MLRYTTALAGIALAGAVSAQEAASVAAANYPLAYFAARLGDEQVSVVYPGRDIGDPATWEPDAEMLSEMQAADVIALNGGGFAGWEATAGFAAPKVVDTTGAAEDRLLPPTAGAIRQAGFTWLDFDIAAVQADALAAAMARDVPGLAEVLPERLSALHEDLAELDNLATQTGAAMFNVTAIASRPYYSYFAAAYEVEIASLDWDPSETPSDADWEELEALVEATGARMFIWDAEPPQPVRERLHEMGLPDAVFAPLAAAPDAGGFVEIMEGSMADLGNTAQRAIQASR